MIELNYIMNQMDLTDTYRTFHPNIEEYMFFSITHWTFSKTVHILGHKVSLNKYRKTEITPCILPNLNGLKLSKAVETIKSTQTHGN